MQRILLVEDNEMNRDLIARRLKRRGFDVLIAVDGAAGVETATAQKPDLILMDIGLPVLDGYEATRLIKENPATRHIPVIGLSAHAMSGDADRAMQAGADDYDTKPVEWSRLLTKIENLLNRAAMQASSAREESQELAAPPAQGTRHVLVIDDSMLRREILSGRLATLGYAFTALPDVRQAFERLDRDTFDAILLDVSLPEIDGRPPLERFRSHPRCQDVPIVMICSVDAIPEAIDCLDYGADEFVPHPYRPQELRSRLDKIFALKAFRNGQQGGGGGAAADLLRARQQVEHVMNGLLPPTWIDELRANHKLPPRRYEQAVVVEWDVPSLEAALDAADPAGLVRLQHLIVSFEDLAEQHGLVTIARPGHDFLAAAGPFSGAADPGLAAARCVLDMLRLGQSLGETLRFGIHAGPVLAGVVGYRHFRFGLWGNTVKWATRVRSTAQSAAHASDHFWKLVQHRVHGEIVGRIPVEGGAVPIHRLDGMT